MPSPTRKQRTPTITKPVGTEFKSVAELRNKAEQSQRSNKIHNYTPKNRVILLPAPAPELTEKNQKKEPKEKQ